MSNLSDKEIDRLSREAAEFYEPDDNMLSWSKLEQQLVKHIPERPPDPHGFFRIRTPIWASAVLLLTGITYFLIKNLSYRPVSTLKTLTERTSPNLPSGTENATGSASVKASASAGGTNRLLPGASSKEPTAAETRERAMGHVPPVRIALPGGGPAGAAATSTSTSGSSKKTTSPPVPGKTGHQGRKTGAGMNQPNGEIFTGNGSATHGTGQNIPETDGSHEKTADQHPAAVHLPLPEVSFTYPVVRGNDSSLNRYPPSDGSQKPSNRKSLRINRSLTIGLVTGPDYTQAGAMSNNQLSDNFGISVGYYLSSRLSLNTGIQYTVKNYQTNGEPFQPRPMNTMITAAYAFPRIETVNGRCNMYEVPLSLRYDFLHQGNTRLFVNAGLSSYLMRNEEYTYFFHNAGRAYEWKNENNEHTDYWFAIGNFSAGIEQEIGKGFSFQAEPFVRKPFRGIGVGNMKMNSFGILFSIRYSPVLGRTRK